MKELERRIAKAESSLIGINGRLLMVWGTDGSGEAIDRELARDGIERQPNDRVMCIGWMTRDQAAARGLALTRAA